MGFTRRNLLKTGATSTAGLMLGSSLSLLPRYALSNNSQVVTVSFSGTACTRDEGEATRPQSDMNIYLPTAGYIPVRINKELGGYTPNGGSSLIGQTVRGVGENDWAIPRDNSQTLITTGPLDISQSNNLASYISSYISGNQLSTTEQVSGYSIPALALHGANLAVLSGAQQINLIGHSRGAVECIVAAWFLYAYGSATVRNIPVNIFAIDPVPGLGTWYSIFTQLPPNVVNYAGVYAWDQCLATDHPYQAVVPCPNGLMRGVSNAITLGSSWWTLADNLTVPDPLAPGNLAQPVGYDLFACRGRHSTVSGNTTADSLYDPTNLSASVAPVPALIYKMARGYLTKWGTTFTTPCAVADSVLALRQKIHFDHRNFDTMGGGETRNSTAPGRPYVRRVSSIWGINPNNTYYMDDVVGDPPYKLVYPVTQDRTNTGWAKWKFL